MPNPFVHPTVAAIRAERGWDGCGMTMNANEQATTTGDQTADTATTGGGDQQTTDTATTTATWKPETPEQQSYIDALIGKRIAEETRKVEKTWQQKVKDAEEVAGKSDLEAANIRATRAEESLNEFRTTAARNLANLHAQQAATAACVDPAALGDVLSLAGADITAAISETGEVDTEKVKAAVEAVKGRLPALFGAQAAAAGEQQAAVQQTAQQIPPSSGGDMSRTTQEHIYTQAEIDSIGIKRLSEDHELRATIKSQIARGLVK